MQFSAEENVNFNLTCNFLFVLTGGTGPCRSCMGCFEDGDVSHP